MSAPPGSPLPKPRQSEAFRDGAFYEFNRVVAAASFEIGREIPQTWALPNVTCGRDVFAPREDDAKRLARKITRARPGWCPPHEPFQLPYYYPPRTGCGRIFFGQRGKFLANESRP